MPQYTSSHIKFQEKYVIVIVKPCTKKGLETILPILRNHNELALAGTLANLADVNRKLGNYDTAFNIGCEGLELAMKMKKRYTIAWISLVLAKVETERGNYKSALSHAKQALEFYEKAGLYFEVIEEAKILIKGLQEKVSK